MDESDIKRLQDLTGRSYIVTGAGQGLGRAYAKALAAAGASVAVTDLNGQKADDVAHEISMSNGRALAVRVDVADETSVGTMADLTHKEFGKIDGIVNNAGIFSTLKMRPFQEIPIEEWNAVLNVNITGVMLCCRSVRPFMAKAGWGRIVNISSSAISMGRPNYLHYTTSKSALLGLTRSLARELGRDGITVNAVLPGATYTEIPRETVSTTQKDAIVAMQCIPRAQQPEDLVGPVLFLLSEGSRFITGQAITVDGGATHN